jgi:dUTP pyrophosphatase
MENSSRFFKNTSCEYYPCHKGIDEMNCLFCYCPLYLEEHCLGNSKLIECGGIKIKDCSNCTYPHQADNYDNIIKFLYMNDKKMRVATFEKVSKTEFADDENYENITIPIRATAGSAGYDFVSPVDCVIKAHDKQVIRTGIRAKIDAGFVLLIFPRSSMGIKKGITLANTCGVIDLDYYFADNEGHIMLCLHNNSDNDVEIKAGDRIAQGIFVPFGLTKDDEVDHQRTGGIGSTGE